MSDLRITTFLFGSLFTSLLSLPTLADSCAATRLFEQDFSSEGITQLEVNVLAGSLEVRPSRDDQIRFSGQACTDEEEWLDWISLDVEHSGSMLIVTVIIPYQDRDFDARYAHMDIELKVPAILTTRLRDSSGDISIENVAVSYVDDSSGGIRVRDNKANLTVRDSSGNIEIIRNTGDLKIMDSSGNIDVRDVVGNVEIPRDSSGEIDIETVSGTVVIGRDGSGDIDIRDVSASVEVGSDGSGSIKIKGVQGNVTIGSDGSGAITVANITGNLLVEAKGSGKVTTRGVEGDISLPR